MATSRPSAGLGAVTRGDRDGADRRARCSRSATRAASVARARAPARRPALRGAPGRHVRDDDLEASTRSRRSTGLARTGVVDAGALGAPPHARRRRGRALRRRPRRGRQDAAGAVRRARRQGHADRRDLDRRDREHAARRVARLPQGGRLRLGPLLPELLPARLRGARLPGRAAVPGVARLRAHPDVDRDDGLRADRLRLSDLRLRMTGDERLRWHCAPGSPSDRPRDRRRWSTTGSSSSRELKQLKDEHGSAPSSIRSARQR